MDKKKLSIFIVLAGLTIALRYMFINTNFWYDEACSWITAKQEFPFGIIDYLLNKDLQHTPLYFFILHFWMKIFGNGEYAIKFLSFIFGIGTVPLVYTAAKKLADKKIAVYATCIASVSPLLVYFSTEARMYSMVTFLVMLSLNYLIDFEKKKKYKSLAKLTIVNVLIPYTLVGGILYNISLMFCYGIYLLKTNKDKFKKYLKGASVEIFLLIPYFLMLIHYAKQRSIFVISHEGTAHFTDIVELIRNFFGLEPAVNIYWNMNEPYLITLTFTLFVIIPCAYLIYGIVQGYKNSNGFNKLLYKIFILIFILFIIASFAKINVLTSRYILYILPPMLILGIIGLNKKLSKKHLLFFLAFFMTFGILGNIKYYATTPGLKTGAFASVAIEANELGLNEDDMVIMPFGSDAPYYFRKATTPRVYDFDFHKEVRNPYNVKYYTPQQQKIISTSDKYNLIYDAIYSNRDLSDAHYYYFKNNVTDKIDTGKRILIALYGNDSNALVTPQELKASAPTVNDVKKNFLEIMLKKYLLDIRLYLNQDFHLQKMYQKGNYTYLLLQKK